MQGKGGGGVKEKKRKERTENTGISGALEGEKLFLSVS